MSNTMQLLAILLGILIAANLLATGNAQNDVTTEPPKPPSAASELREQFKLIFQDFRQLLTASRESIREGLGVGGNAYDIPSKVQGHLRSFIKQLSERASTLVGALRRAVSGLLSHLQTRLNRPAQSQ